MKPENKNILDDDHIVSLLFRMSMPAFIGMFVMTLYNIVDTIFIGHYVGSLGIAALSIVFPVQMLSMGIGQLTGMGGASLISRLIGSKEVQKAELSLGNAISSTFILSIIIMIAGLVWLEPLLMQLGASEAIFPYAQEYMQIILFSMFLQSFCMLLSTLIRAEGNTRIPMVSMVVGALLNIVLDALFIIVLEMGVQGAAIATVIGQCVSLFILIRFYLSGKNYLNFKVSNLIFDWPIIKQMFAIGISAFAMSVATSLSAVFVNLICLEHGGDIAVSAFGIISRVIMLALIPGMVIGMGLQPIIGFNYGAKRYDRILSAISISSIVATGCCIIAFLLMEFFAEPFIAIFTSDQELIATTAYGSRRFFAAIFLVGFVFIGITVFQALGLAVHSFIASIARTALFLIPAVFILPNYMGLDGVWWAFSLADVLTFALTLILFIPQLSLFKKQKQAMLTT